MANMTTTCFSLQSDVLKDIDHIASSLKRTRSSIINEALASYITKLVMADKFTVDELLSAREEKNNG